MALRKIQTKPTKPTTKATAKTTKVERTPRKTREAAPTGGNVEAEVAAMIGELNGRQQTALGKFLKTMVAKTHREDMSDLDTKTTRGRRPKSVEPEEAPKTRGRRPKFPVLEDVTIDGVIEYMENLEVEPTPGGIRELTPKLKEYGGDLAVIASDATSRAEKAEAAGLFVSTMIATEGALLKVSEDDLNTLVDELGIEAARKKADTVRAILTEINSFATESDDEDEEEDDEDEEEDDEEAEEDDDEESDEDEDEDEDDEEEDEEDESDDELADIDDEDDLDDLDEKPTRNRRK